MQAKKCDRCGEFYTSNTIDSGYRRQKDAKTKCVIRGASLSFMTIDGAYIPTSTNSKADFDLCDNCINAFLDWINMKEGDNHD